MNKIAGVVALLSGNAYATLRFGGCPYIKPMTEFDMSRYMGRWYEIVRDQYIPFELYSDCANVNYDMIEGTDYVQVHNKNVYPIYGWYDMVGQGIQVSEGVGSFIVDFYETADPKARANYNVLDTDYESYSVVYSCEELAGGWAHFDYLWVLGRETTMEDAQFASVVDFI